MRIAEPGGEILHRRETDPHRPARPPLPVGEPVEARHRLGEFVIPSHRQHDDLV